MELPVKVLILVVFLAWISGCHRGSAESLACGVDYDAKTDTFASAPYAPSSVDCVVGKVRCTESELEVQVFKANEKGSWALTTTGTIPWDSDPSLGDPVQTMQINHPGTYTVRFLCAHKVIAAGSFDADWSPEAKAELARNQEAWRAFGKAVDEMKAKLPAGESEEAAFRWGSAHGNAQ